ncbi:MAG: hypothetical protein ONB37_05080 [candidate division KSB1 bacterium]|nr:hypothetical protein [candidate division KSB1 bacterium]
MRRLAFGLIVLLCLFCTEIFSVEPIPLRHYLEFSRNTADWTWQHHDSLISVWKKNLDPNSAFGYIPPGALLEMATIYAFLFEAEGKKDYADRAKQVLLSYGDYRKEYPETAIKRRADYEDGLPALPNIFTAMRYIRSYETLKRLKYLSPSEQKTIEAIIAESMDFILRTQEWGAMNRGILRAECLAWAIRAMPDHPRAPIWRMLEKSIGMDNWGNWEIEDASLYNAVWLYSLLGYADALGKMDELFRTPEMYYNAQYFLHLMCPDGMIPDFGDANWHSNWDRFLVFFEAAARAYRDSHLKWAASIIAKKFIKFDNAKSASLGCMLLDCYRFGSDVDLAAEPPTELSEEVMDDIVGKKIVLRNGWQANSTYLLLNYRDEGDGGRIFRDYLRDTIPVEEEKMTHGHADENSIVLLMNNGAILLHDGGYRDYMPSGPFGAYRQDYFHNRLCVRQEKIWMGQKEGEYRYQMRDAVPGQPLLDFLHNAGSYRQVRTQKIDFISLPEFDYSRTRVIDDKLGYEWDRVITYVKALELFVVFDIFKTRVEEFFTIANVWHTRKIVAQGNHWYDVVYDSLGKLALPADQHLLILFPQTHFRLEGIESEKRYYQNELAIYQMTGQHFELGQHIGFITVLIPHPANEAPQQWMDNIKVLNTEPENAALAIEIQDADRQFTIGAKQDLRMDMIRDWRRPKYTYESGRIAYGDFETNGDFLFAMKEGKKLNYTAVNLTRIKYKDAWLLDPKPAQFSLAFDGSPDAPGVGKLRYWRGERQLK